MLDLLIPSKGTVSKNVPHVNKYFILSKKIKYLVQRPCHRLFLLCDCSLPFVLTQLNCFLSQCKIASLLPEVLKKDKIFKKLESSKVLCEKIFIKKKMPFLIRKSYLDTKKRVKPLYLPGIALGKCRIASEFKDNF